VEKDSEIGGKRKGEGWKGKGLSEEEKEDG
jgi:hypothetical protein